MKIQYCFFLFLFYVQLTSAQNLLNGAKVIVKKELCPPEEYGLEERMNMAAPKVMNEDQIGAALKTLSYDKVVKKLNNNFTGTKWKLKSEGKRIDTIIIITYGRQSDRLVYRKLNRSAGNSVPVLLSASIIRNQFDAGGIKVGMSRKEVCNLLQININEHAAAPLVYITNGPENILIEVSFVNNMVGNINYTGYPAQ